MMKNKTWEKEFDKKFVEKSGICGWKDKHIYRDGGEIHIKRVKQFIRKTRADAVRETILDIALAGKGKQGYDWDETISGKVFNLVRSFAKKGQSYNDILKENEK